MTLPAHMMIVDGGALYDTRGPDWSASPLRANYSRTHERINSLADVKATLRAGGFAWPGGYPMYLVMKDGETLSFKAARAEFRQIARAMLDGARDTQWVPVACEINYEDSELYCDHTGMRIPSAYGEE